MAFTFDDGPHPEYTPRVLDALASAGARATFFLIGESARAHPAIVRRTVTEGHEIGLHSSSHVAMTELGVRERFAALRRGRHDVGAAAGRRPRWFRAPYGLQTIDTVVAGRVLRMRPVMWSAYACEWEDRPLDECIDHAARGMVPGAIVLLHDGPAGDDDRQRSPDEILALLDALLDLAVARGLRVVPVGELLALGRTDRRLWLRSWRVDG